MKIILDTNVLVSALWNPHGPPAKVLLLVAEGRVQPVHSSTILAEYRDVLTRPRFGFNPARVTQILDYFQLVGVGVTGKSSGRRLPDLTDLPFLDAALEGRETRIVTGNLKDFPVKACLPVKPVGPAEFLAEFLRI